MDRRLSFAVGALVTIAFVLAQALSAAARGAPESFADLAEALSPSVVNITTTTNVPGRVQPELPKAPDGTPFEDLFKDFFDKQDKGQGPRKASALGSGFVISADGYIVTNNHVIDGADEITIEFFDGEEREAKLIGTDPKTDIAVLKVEADDPLPFVGFGDSDVARVGDWVLAIGNPLGQRFSVSAGIISARKRTLRSGPYDDFIQTDAAINRGNSGGPLFNMDGDVIGVNTAIISPTGGSVGLGFSMASNVVTRVVDQLLEFGETRRGWLGVRIQDVDPDLAEALGLESTDGALVSDVPDGPAKESGMISGDVILSFDGQDVENIRGLVNIVGNTDVGKSVRVVVFRDGKTQTLKVVLGRREEAEKNPVVPVSIDPADTVEVTTLGMTLVELNDEMRTQLNLAADLQGVIVAKIEEDSNAFEKGVRQGDVITEVAQTPVTSPSDVTAAFDAGKEAGRKTVLLLIRRDGDPRFVAIELE